MFDYCNNGEHFISLVQQNTVLWNKKNVNFKNVILKNKVWQKIGDVFDLTGEQTAQIFTSLRQKYLREKEKENADKRIKKPWFLMKSMRFLDEVIVPRKAHSPFILLECSNKQSGFVSLEENLENNTILQTSPSSSALLPSTISKSSPASKPTPVTFSAPPPASATSLSLSSSSSPPLPSPSPSPPLPPPSKVLKKRKSSENEMSSLIVAGMESPKIKIQREDNWKVKNEVETFCKYLGTRLNKLPDTVRGEFENDILQRLYKIETNLRN